MPKLSDIPKPKRGYTPQAEPCPPVALALQEAITSGKVAGLAYRLRALLRQPVTRENNRKYCELWGLLVAAMGWRDQIGMFREWTNACAHGHAKPWYDTYGRIHCEICHPPEVHRNVIPRLDLDNPPAVYNPFAEVWRYEK